MQNTDALTRLALDLGWSWNHSAGEIWKKLDPELWERTANAWLILQATSPQMLARLSDPELRTRVERLLAEVGETRRRRPGSRPYTERLRSAPWRTSAWSTC